MTALQQLHPVRIVSRVRGKMNRYSLKPPHTYWVEITNACNLKCIMCPQSTSLKRPRRMMDYELFEKFLSGIPANRPLLKLYMLGEPLLHKELIRMIDHSHRMGCETMIHTNATLLDGDMSERILRSALDYITFSFDGCTPEIYESIRVGARFSEVKANIETFLDLKARMGVHTPHVTIDILKMKMTESHLNSFVSQWEQHPSVDDVHIQPCVTWMDEVNDYRVDKPRNLGHKPCLALFNSSAILADGTVVPCCMDVNGALSMGNVRAEAFTDIWENEAYSRLRQQHLENSIPEDSICHGCQSTWIQSRAEQTEVAALRLLGRLPCPGSACRLSI